MTPTLHMSTALSYPSFLSTSGATYPGVPHVVDIIGPEVAQDSRRVSIAHVSTGNARTITLPAARPAYGRCGIAALVTQDAGRGVLASPAIFAKPKSAILISAASNKQTNKETNKRLPWLAVEEPVQLPLRRSAAKTQARMRTAVHLCRCSA
jgi:hypothetical protein